MRTQRPHFEELDWLDFEQGLLSTEEKAEMEAHLSFCPTCSARLSSLRRLSRALAPMRHFLDAAEGSPRSQNVALLERVEREANDLAEKLDRAEHDVMAFPEKLPGPETVPGLSWHHIFAANRAARELLGSDLPRARALVGWCQAALPEIERRPEGLGRWNGIRGAVAASAAYLRFRDGNAARALEEFDVARALYDEPVPLRDLEQAFWSYARAQCLHSLSRFEEGLQEIAAAEEIYIAFGDGRRRARCRFARAIQLSDSGAPERALPIYEELLADKDLVADAPIHALVHLSLANDLVFTGEVSRAKAVYARATNLLRKTGQEDRLFRVRVGLADIAYREGRVEEALELNLQLRPIFRERHLAWDEVRRELWIARQFLELGRFEEAQEVCRDLASRSAELSLRDEARRALAFLARADRDLMHERLTLVQHEVDLLARGRPPRGSVA